MKLCPYCGNELPEDNTIYCVKCDHIIDEDFILRQKINEELKKMKPAKMKAKARPKKNQPPAPARRRKDDYVPKVYYEEKKSYANFILIAIVVIIFLFMFFK